VGSSQREATFVAIGLVIVASLVLIYLFNESNRRSTAEESKTEESATRGAELFAQYCVACHGPDGKATGRIGIPLNTPQNQVQGADWDQRLPIVEKTIERGRGQIMPAWAESEGGPLNPQQVQDVITLIHTGAWDTVTELVMKSTGGVEPTIPPAPTVAGGTPTDPLAAQGQQIYSQSCAACHTIDGSTGTGPSWKGLYGHDVQLESGDTVTADDAYIHESILDPTAKVVKGFQPIMPSFQGQLTDDQINALIAYMKTLQ
jgi:mono/diheme cytochrome c family protein